MCILGVIGTGLFRGEGEAGEVAPFGSHYEGQQSEKSVQPTGLEIGLHTIQYSDQLAGLRVAV